MKTWLRQHRYALLTSLRRFATQPFSSITNLLVIVLTLTVPLVGAALLVSIQPLSHEVSTHPQITIFLQPKLTHAQGQAVLGRLLGTADEENYHAAWIPREQAIRQLREQTSWREALDTVGENPLPDAIVVTLMGPEPVEQAARLAPQWQAWQEVDIVQMDGEWIQRLQSLLTAIRIGLGLLALGVAVIVLATVFNTVRLQALAQREEITVARLVGATEAFVRRPFLYQGALAAGIAALLALLAAKTTLIFLNRSLTQLIESYGSDFSLRLPGIPWLVGFVLAVALLGAFSARWSVTRNTRY